MKAPWIYHVLLDDSDDGNYIIPKYLYLPIVFMFSYKNMIFHYLYFYFSTNTVVLGGTHQENDFNTKISKEDSKFIREGCEQIVPGLKVYQQLV